MNLSTKGRYAARAMLELSIHYGNQPVRLKEIAEHQDISVRYLEQMMTMLVASGLIRSIRGTKGGFSLSRPPQEILLSDVVQVVEGSLAPVACVDDAGLCDRADMCVTRDIWDRMKEALLQVLDSITLADMVNMHNKKVRDSNWENARNQILMVTNILKEIEGVEPLAQPQYQ